MEGGFCPCPKELRKLGLGNDSTTASPKSLDTDQPSIPEPIPIAINPPAVQAPSTSGQAGAPSQRQQTSNLLDSGTGLGLAGANELPAVGAGQNNLVQIP